MNRRMSLEHVRELQQCVSTFYATSRRKMDDARGCNLPEYCLSEKCDWKAIDFDSVQHKWYANVREQTGKMPCSVDAICLARGNIYAVEFKCGKNIDGPNLFRKIYDTVMGFIEHAGLNFEACRQQIVYVVVAPLKNDEYVISRVNRYINRPWENPRNGWDRWKLSSLCGVIVRQTIVLPPELFSDFARAENLTTNDWGIEQ